jgi:hypothetical protein
MLWLDGYLLRRRFNVREWGSFVMLIEPLSHVRFFKMVFALSAITGALSAPFQNALAITLQSKGGGVFLSGSIKAGDQFEFREFVAQANPRFIDLDSKGGNIDAAGGIGDIIRGKNLPTVVDASRSTCGSACTIIFAAGTSRHYIGAEKIPDHLGNTNEKGLGYHEGNNFLSTGKKGQSGAATGKVIEYYYKYGSSKAASIVTKGDWKHFYYISTATALESGLATSAKKP